jgi:hypothetical protein
VTWYSGIVVDNQDPDQRGRLRLRIPGLLGPDAIAPDWVPARVVGGAAGRAVGLWWCPPVDAIVLVEVDGARMVWSGGEISGSTKLPDELLEGYPRRSGMTSPGGGTRLFLDESDIGFGVVLRDRARALIGSANAAIAVAREPELAAWIRDTTLWEVGHTHLDPMTGTTGVPTTSPPAEPNIASTTLFVRD